MKDLFQSPYGGIGASDADIMTKEEADRLFQSPYGGIGASDKGYCLHTSKNMRGFQSPYGGIGASDSLRGSSQKLFRPVSITLRWHRCIRLDREHIG